MSWIVASALMYFFSVVLYLAIRKLQIRKVPNIVNNTLMYFVGMIFFSILALGALQELTIKPEILFAIFLITIFFSYLGNVFSLEGIQHAQNPGVSLMIQKSYAVYTAVASVFLFGSELTLKNVIAIVIVISFLSLLVYDGRKKGGKLQNKSWIMYSFLAFFLFGNLALSSKWLLDMGLTPLARAFYLNFFLAVIFVLDLFRNIRKSPELKQELKNKSNYILFLTIGVSNSLFNLFMQYAFRSAPNVGYVNVINAASITGVAVFSALIYKDKLNLQKAIGVIGATVGIMVLLV